MGRVPEHNIHVACCVSASIIPIQGSKHSVIVLVILTDRHVHGYNFRELVDVLTYYDGVFSHAYNADVQQHQKRLSEALSRSTSASAMSAYAKGGWHIYCHLTGTFHECVHDPESFVTGAGMCHAYVDEITDANHPAYVASGSRCARASMHLKPGSIIGSYSYRGSMFVSGKCPELDSMPMHQYQFMIEGIEGQPSLVIAPDTTAPLCCINDPRGTAIGTANSEFLTIVDPRSGRCDIVLVAVTRVFRGDELLADYGSHYWIHAEEVKAEWDRCCSQAKRIVQGKGLECLKL